MTVDVALLGIKVTSETAVKAASDLDKMTVSAGRADVAVDRVGVASGKMAKGMGAGAHQSKMVAMQLSQVAQQSMATGNFVQALAIQLPDMALGFGTIGIAAGVLAGVALPLIVSMFGSTSSSAAETAKTLEALAEKTQIYATAAAAARAPTAELAATYGTLAVAAREALEAMAAVTLVDAIAATNAAVQSVTDSLIELRTEAVGRGTKTSTFLVDDFGLAADAAQGLRDALVTLQNADGLADQAQAAAEVSSQLMTAYGSIEKMPAPLQAAMRSLAGITIEAGKTVTITSRLPELLSAAASAANSAASAVAGIGSAASGAYGAVEALVSKMLEMAKARSDMFRDSKLGWGKVANAGGVDAIARAGNQALAVDSTGTLATGAAGAYKPPGDGDGGGGVGGGDDFAARLDKLRTEHETELQQANAWYAEAQATMADRRSLEILGEQGHKDKLLEIETIHQQQLAAIQATAQAARLEQTAGLFGALASIAEAGGKKGVKAAAAFQAIQGTISAYSAATQALATPGLTLAGRFAAYASVLAAGLKGVMAIRQAGGIGGGGGGGRVAAQASAPAQQQSRLIIQGIKLTDIFTGAMLFDMLGEEAKLRNIEFVR